MPSQAIEFQGSSGQSLAARLELPVGPIRAVALFAHCFTCTMNSHAANRITTALAGAGIATMRFDFTGLGGSEGDFANAHFLGDVADIVAAADHLRASIAAPALLIGHSLGGAAVLAAAERIPEARGVVTIGAPFDPAHVLEAIRGDLAAIEREGAGAVTIGGRSFRIGAQFLHSLRAQDPAIRIGAIGRALLVLHAPGDEVVGIDNARLIFDAARHPKSFVTLDDADHLLTRRSDAAYVAALIAAWAERYLAPAEAAPMVAEGEVFAGNAGGKFGTTVRTHLHSLVADEPVAVGGEDAGPGPYDLLLGALGACTSMTLKLYAARKDIPLEDVAIRLTHDRNHGVDCDHCTDPASKIEAIERTIRMTGPLSESQRADLMRIADKCPVHRTLTGELHVHTREEPQSADEADR
ncbi:bifunctional alpha/beta hydrolase/OsmC family protein [Sphingosinithalassobacter sp. CS137]|uniref:bifunctional alpha/beta hydrolase/OsmC family protein n=1 Tax=Sphingosinithalassobacter sp. CS137 TaxID=2762748 RepID=UPI00165E81F9|nr:bifunctional alpha/beta hydrolase/OsmC family protein [Sphingosinithalassobacter sp. CS137]